MSSGTGRRVTVVLCGPAGDLIGALPPIELELPWFAEVGDLVDAVRDTFGLEVTVLRLLDADRPPGPDGGAHVVHLAQLDSPTAVPDARLLTPVPPLPAHALADHARRRPYARAGGPADDVAWAERELVSRGTPPTGAPRQVRTWNLSSIWRIPTSAGPVWLKVVPPFFAHEGAVIAIAGGVTGAVPPLLAHEGGRVLLADVPGQDLFHAPLPVLLRMVELLVGAQAALVGRVPDLLDAGAFDWRPEAFEPIAQDVVERTGEQLDAADRASLGVLLRGLPERFAEIGSCGIPDTLVHGDFHPGNVRGRLGGTPGEGEATSAARPDERLVVLDWGDAGVGNPLLDQAALLGGVPAADRLAIARSWSARWRAAAPGCDPARAAALLAPVAALRQAMIYRLFLDQIEPSEHIYHQGDPPIWLAKAAALARR